MKKVFDFGSGFIMVLLLLVGIGYIIAAFSHEEGAFFAIGFGCLISDVFWLGFSYIVQAACRYLERNNDEHESE